MPWRCSGNSALKEMLRSARKAPEKRKLQDISITSVATGSSAFRVCQLRVANQSSEMPAAEVPEIRLRPAVC